MECVSDSVEEREKERERERKREKERKGRLDSKSSLPSPDMKRAISSVM